MNFMKYGKTQRLSIPGTRLTFIPEKYWVPTALTKPNNRHDLFFKPQQEDLETQTPKAKTTESNDDTVLTIKATSFFNREESTLYMAITEGRGNASCEVGIAAIDMQRPELIICQISDNLWYTGLLTKIAILSPTEILLPQALINSNKTSKLYLYIKQTYPDVPIRGVPRRQFNDKKALEIIDQIHNSKYQSIRDMISKKYYALTASSALLQYLEYILNYSFAPNSLKIRYESKYACMTIDLDTSHHLELLYPTCKTKEQRACLFGVLNSCVTSIGKRNLRAQILQPSCELAQITKTQECIKELIGNDKLFLSLVSTLAKFHSVDKLMKFAVLNTTDLPTSSETMISQILQLKACLENVPELCCLLATINNNYFDDMKTVLVNAAYDKMLNQINTVVHPNAQVTGGTTQFFQRLHAVNSNISSYLDLNRKNYTKLVDQMNEAIGNLSAAHNLPFRMKFINSKGFHIQFTVSKNSAFPQLPNTFEVLSKTKNCINLTTNELRMLNIRMFDVVEQIHIESNRIIGELINNIRHNMAQLYDLCGLISSLDIVLSLTKYSINSQGCCPSFGSEMNVIDGIHPLLEHSRCKTTPVPNGVIANSEYHFFVITGPNMGGKTIYLKMIAMLQVLAQLGCFVPAKKAQFRLTDKILSRIGFGDRLECNLSGFVLEMRETEYIFKNVTPNSLVIIDELCRSTKPEEGEVLAWDICERLIRLVGVSNDGRYFDESSAPNKSKSSNKLQKLASITSPFIFFVTHFDSITKLQDKFLSVVNLRLSAKEELIDGKNHLMYTYRIEDGVNQIKNYGISLAQYMNFPPDVISRAVSISVELRQKQLPLRPNKNSPLLDNSTSNKPSTFRSTILETSTSEQSRLLRLFYDLYADMVSISHKTIPAEEKRKELNQKMKELSQDLPSHVLEMAKKGNLFQFLVGSSGNAATNIDMKLRQEVVEEAQNELQVDSCRSRIRHNSTNFSLLSNYSIARRIGLDLDDTKEDAIEASHSSKVSEHRNKSKSKVQFVSDGVEEITNQSFDDYFMENQFNSGVIAAGSSFVNNDFNLDVEDISMDFVDHELTQYFSNMSAKHAKDRESLTCSIPDVLDKPRSCQNASTEAQAGTSSKDAKAKTTGSNTSQKSSSSSGLFRLQMKTPLKVKDNRILKTPPRDKNQTPKECSFGNRKDSSQRRSTPQLSFNLFDDIDFSGVEIPTILSTSKNTGEFSAVDVPAIELSKASQKSNDSIDESFQLNFTQFCARESAENSFFCFTPDLKNGETQMFPDFSDAMPIPLNVTYRVPDESFTFPGMASSSSKQKSSRHKLAERQKLDRSTSSQLHDLTCPSTSQTGNFFNMNWVSQNTKEVAASEASFVKKVTSAPDVSTPTALQYIQYAYQGQSDNDSATDEESTEPFTRKEGRSKSVVWINNRNKVERKNLTGKINPTATEDSNLLTELVNIPTVDLENVEDIILPVPSQFL